MHALPSHPWTPLVLAIVAALLALIVLAAPDLVSLDLSIGSEAPPAQPVTASPPVEADPTWLRDPLASPIETLTSAR